MGSGLKYETIVACWSDGSVLVGSIWLVAIGLAALGFGQALRRCRWQRLQALPTCQAGLSYTLSYVMVIPVYLFVILIAYEATWLLVAKIGTMYAAHAGARAAVVWDSMDPGQDRTRRIEQATTTAMAPFATPNWKHISWGGGPTANGVLAAEEYVLAHRQYAQAVQAPPPRRRPYPLEIPTAASLRLRYYCASSRLRWQYQVLDSRPGGDLRFEVVYRAPLRIPGPARWLSARPGPPWEYEIRSFAVLPHEAPATESRTLGIRYRSATRYFP